MTDSGGGGFDIRSAIISGSDGGAFRISLSPVQVAACEEALIQLRKKLERNGGGSIVDSEFENLQGEAMMRKFKHSFPKITVALQISNRSKNRYVNVLPYDDTRVQLEGPDHEHSPGGYINASYIQDTAHEALPKYIATQGPLRGTNKDFWLMVLEQHCPVIIMLTGISDGNQPNSKVSTLISESSKQERCAPYYPPKLQQAETYGQLRVTNKSLSYSQHSVCKRLFEVHNLQDTRPPHTVVHYEYLGWPDCGVPISTQPVRELIRELYKIAPTAGPFVVHCSAGIGRSGTYCTSDHTLRRIIHGDLTAVDLERTVRVFRQQRDGMVETREQYHFCYRAVVEELEEYLASQRRT